MAMYKPASAFGIDNYPASQESNLAAQKSGSWTWRDPDVAHLSKALSINLPLYARAARKQSSKAPLRELSNQSLHSNCSQGQDLPSRQPSERSTEAAQNSGRSTRDSRESAGTASSRRHRHSRAESDPGLSKMGLGKTVLQAYRDSKGSIKHKLSTLLSRNERGLGSKTKVHPMSPVALEPEPDVRPHNMDYLAYFGGAEHSTHDDEVTPLGDKACIASIRHASSHSSPLKMVTR